jgi:hypothetical protein
MVWVRERTIPTERPPLIGEVIANFLRIEGATWSTWRIPTAVFSVFQTGAATFLSGSSSVVPTRLSGPRSRPTFYFFFLVVPGIEPGPPDLQPRTYSLPPIISCWQYTIVLWLILCWYVGQHNNYYKCKPIKYCYLHWIYLLDHLEAVSQICHVLLKWSKTWTETSSKKNNDVCICSICCLDGQINIVSYQATGWKQ